MKDCIDKWNGHAFQNNGTKFWATDRRLPGSGAREVFYYSSMLCPKCGIERLQKLSAKTDTYGNVLFSATPVTEEQEKVLSRDPHASEVLA